MIKNKDLSAELVISKLQGKLTKNTIDILKIFSKKIISKFVINEDSKLDCYNYCMSDFIRYWYYYDDEKNNHNAFLYFSCLIERAIFKGTPVRRKGYEHNIKLISISNDGLRSI